MVREEVFSWAFFRRGAELDGEDSMKLRNIIFAAAVSCLIGFEGNAWGQTQTGSDGDWEFTYSTNDWTATVTEYRGTSSTPTVPSTVKKEIWENVDGEYTYIIHTFKVTAMSGSCFGDNVTSVSVPSSVTTLGGFSGCSNLVAVSCAKPPKAIGSMAFYGCMNLRGNIDLSQCTSIGSHAFSGCHSLEFGEFRLPNATNIDHRAFEGCNGITSVELPKGLKSLASDVFDSCQNLKWAKIDGTDLTLPGLFFACSNLQSVIVGDGVTSISGRAFYSIFDGCHSLRDIEIGTGVDVVASNLFHYLGGLERVTFRGNIQCVGESAFAECTNLMSVSLGGKPKTIDDSAFYNCRRLTETIDLSQCTNIGASAFANCDGLSSIEMPSCLQVLGTGAFRSCQGLTSAIIDGTDLTLPCYVLANCSNLQNVVIGNGVTGVAEYDDYDRTPFWKSLRLRNLEVGTGITAISNYLCYGLPELETATFRGDIQSIGMDTFARCSNLVSVALGGAPKSIGRRAFEDCTALEGHIDLSRCTGVGEWAFRNCQRMDGDIDLTHCASVEYGAFEDCHALSSVEFSPCVTSIGGSAFARCGSLKFIVLPSSLRALGDYAFAGCGNLLTARIDGTDLVLPNSVLNSCTNLLEVTIGDGVTSISTGGWGVFGPFSGCHSLRDIEIGMGVSAVVSNLCYDLTGLERVVFRGNIQSVGECAFWRCTNLVMVTLGGKPKTIGDSAFYNCRRLTETIDLSQCASVGAGAFSGCAGLSRVDFGRGLEVLGNSAFSGCTGLADVWFKGGVPTVGSAPFKEVAEGARGHYSAAHRAEWKAVIGADGKWQGLLMAEIPGPVLRVDSANPAEGSLTLAWNETATVEGVTYSVYRSANDAYSTADLVTNGLTCTSWTDTNYWDAEPILKPLNYWAVADGGGYGPRISNREETRHRYALSVGVGRYRDSAWSTDLSDITYANLFYDLVKDFSCEPTIVLTGQNATKAAIQREMQGLAQRVKTGDYLFVFCSSHGTTSSWRNLAEKWWEIHSWLDFKGIAMYDTLEKECTFENLYTTEEIKSDLEQIFSGKNGVSFAFLLNCCMSGGVVDFSPSNGEIAWITSCQETELTPTWTNAFGTPLPKHFFDYGWNQGRAWHGDYLTLADLVDYAIPSLSTFFLKVEKDNTPVVKGENILEHFIVGRPGNASHAGPPSIPSGLTATSGKEQISVSWTPNADTDCFLLRRTDPDGSNPMVYVINGKATSGKDKDADRFGKTYLYSISAMNEHGITSWSRSVPGSRVLTSLVQWISDIFGFDDSTPAETLAAAAASASANGTSYEACFIADIDPNDPDASFEAELVREDGKWKAKPKGGEKEGRVYRVEGKKEMSDEYWTDVTDVEGLEAEGWHFFRVGVELAE